MGRLQDKTSIVTGAGAGIGFATAQAFAAEGARVIALDRAPDGLERLAEICPAVECRILDVTDATAVGGLFDALGAVDVLFNCAGIVAVGNLTACSDYDWTRTMDLNMTAIFYMCRSAVPIMQDHGGGSIINMASVISSIGAAPDRFAYGVSKAAVIGLTKSIALDYAADNIRCNAICPSAVETPSMTGRIAVMEDPRAARADFEGRQPVGRMARPDEIAEMAVYLASDMSGFVTGSAVIMDGGAKL